jgi:short-subunit dehydrogenase
VVLYGGIGAIQDAADGTSVLRGEVILLGKLVDRHVGTGIVPTSQRKASPRMKFPTQDCTAIITGASSGLGAEFARQLALQARMLVLVARRIESLEAVKTNLLAIRPDLEVHLVVADLALADGRSVLVDWVKKSGISLNLLINNAGLGDYGTLASATQERLQAQIDVNVTALVLLTHALLPHLQANVPAGIINISSLAGTIPMPDHAVYSASKAFVTSFSEALAVELQSQHIQVTCVCPGPTPTNFSMTARRPDGTDTDRSGQRLLRIPSSQVVAEALAGLRDGKVCVFPGRGVSIAGSLFRLLPRALMRWFLRRRFNKGTL